MEEHDREKQQFRSITGNEEFPGVLALLQGCGEVRTSFRLVEDQRVLKAT